MKIIYHKLYPFSEENVQGLGEHFLGHNVEKRDANIFKISQ
jgi:hypothetical protein